MPIRAAWVAIRCARSGKYLLGKRTKRSKYGTRPWGLFGGRPDKGEKKRRTACRELREETGLRIEPSELRKIGEIEGDHFYEYESRGGMEEAVVLNREEFKKAEWFSREEMEAMPLEKRHRSVRRLLDLLAD